MATSPTPEQNEVRRKGRQRLIGAVAIVLLAVVFIPMILDPEPRKERPEAQLRAEQALAIPPKEGAPPLPAPVAMPSKPAAPAAPAEAPKVEVKVEARIEPKSGAKVEPKPEPKAAAVAPSKTAKAPELKGFAVQVGAFRDEEKLKLAREKLLAAKIPHFTERLAAGDLTRLRAGPYPTREAAEKALPGVKAAGLEGKVVPLP